MENINNDDDDLEEVNKNRVKLFSPEKYPCR